MANGPTNEVNAFEEKLKQRVAQKSNSLETKPIHVKPQGSIPNTPLASATIAFILGGFFTAGLCMTASDLISLRISFPYQLGIYLSSWAFFHWAEFGVTAGWNLEKCTIDCSFYMPSV